MTLAAQFLSQKKKKHSTQNCMYYNTKPDFQFSFLFIFKKYFKILEKGAPGALFLKNLLFILGKKFNQNDV